MRESKQAGKLTKTGSELKRDETQVTNYKIKQETMTRNKKTQVTTKKTKAQPGNYRNTLEQDTE